jgi:hypothetical protein
MESLSKLYLRIQSSSKFEIAMNQVLKAPSRRGSWEFVSITFKYQILHYIMVSGRSFGEIFVDHFHLEVLYLYIPYLYVSDLNISYFRIPDYDNELHIRQLDGGLSLCSRKICSPSPGGHQSWIQSQTRALDYPRTCWTHRQQTFRRCKPLPFLTLPQIRSNKPTRSSSARSIPPDIAALTTMACIPCVSSTWPEEDGASRRTRSPGWSGASTTSPR